MPSRFRKKHILYYDCSLLIDVDKCGSDRFSNGRKFAEDNFDEITKGLGGQAVYLVSHSEGGAYAAGIADYLHNNGIEIDEHILLSPDEGDEFSINPEIPSYQLTLMFFSDSISNKKWIQGIRGLKFKKWGSYYAVVDWITNEYKVKGITKMGIAHIQSVGWTGVHGSTNSSLRFLNLISDLKEVKTFDVTVKHEGKTYSGKDHKTTSNGTVFYRVDEDYIITNCPPIKLIT